MTCRGDVGVNRSDLVTHSAPLSHKSYFPHWLTGLWCKRPDAPLPGDASGLATRTGQTERMTDFPIPRICAALALACPSHKEIEPISSPNTLEPFAVPDTVASVIYQTYINNR